MLAAIRTTILSRRSWAETCSAMVSRSRLSKTRGPPDVLRMWHNPPSWGQSGGQPRPGTKLAKSNSFLDSMPLQAPDAGPNQDNQHWGTVRGSGPARPYSELGLVLPSKRPASRKASTAFGASAKASHAYHWHATASAVVHCGVRNAEEKNIF